MWILQAFTKSIGASKKELFFKREDISTIAEIAKEEGIIGKKDSNFIKNIVKLRNVSVKEIMTPYSVMVTADQNSTINEFYQKNPELVFSRIPILNKNMKPIIRRLIDSPFFLKKLDRGLRIVLINQAEKPIDENFS